MKNSGIEWIGEIPDDWALIRFKDIFINRKEIAGTRSFLFDRLALTMNGVIKRDKDDSDGLQPKEFDGYQIIYENDFIFKMIDLQNISTSRVGLSPYTGLVSPAYIRFSPRKKGQYNLFVYYFLMSLYYNCVYNNLGGNGVRSALNATDMGQFLIPFPSTNTQIQIVSMIENRCAAVERLITNQQEQIEKLKEYKQSVISEAVTKGLDPSAPLKDSGIEWIGNIPKSFQMTKIKNIGIYFNGLTYSPNDITDETKGTLVLRSSNIKNGKLILDDNVYVSCDIRKNLMVKKGDILVCSRNGSRNLIGKNAIIDKDICCSFGAFMMIFRCECSKYMYYILSSDIFNYYLGSFFTATINQLTGQNFGNMSVPFCSIKEEQKQITDYLDKKCTKIDRLISIKQQKIEKLQEYKKSLIYEYVTGKKEVLT